MPADDPDIVRQTVGKILVELFPDVRAVSEHGMQGWTIDVPTHLAASKTGTMDPRRVLVLIRSGKGAITVHFWNPVDFAFLARRKHALEKAGFDVMVGCVRFARQRAFPVEALRPLLEDVRRSFQRAATIRSKNSPSPIKRGVSSKRR